MHTLRLFLLLGCLSVSAFAHPLRIAHRGGTGDAPENTPVAIEQALRQGVSAIWVTVQLSSDGVPVLYRPATLEVLTDHAGPVSAKSAAELARVDAAWKAGGAAHPWRGKGISIPTLEAVLQQYPAIPFFLDLKSPDADPQVMARALQAVLQRTASLSRVRVYSTDSRALDALAPEVPRFESRDLTRSVLAARSRSLKNTRSARHVPRLCWSGTPRPWPASGARQGRGSCSLASTAKPITSRPRRWVPMP